MKTILIFITIFYFTEGEITHAQENRGKNATICHCQINDSMVKSEIEQYLIRNHSYENKKTGITLIKFYSQKNNGDYYKFVLTQVLFTSTLSKNKPKTYTLIKGLPVFIYNAPQGFICKKEKNKKFYYLISRDFLIGNSNEKIRYKNGLSIIKDINFDPEILEVIIKQDSIISKRELSVQPSW